MDRCALFVDAGYMLADGAMAVHGTRRREAVTWDYEGLLQLLGNLARDRTGLPLLRCYWYEATVEGRRTAEHEALADMPGIKLRLARTRPGGGDAVGTEIHRDLTVLARNGAVSDAVVVSAEEDLAGVIADVQDLGMRVTIAHVAVDGSRTTPRALRQECDDVIELTSAHLRPYVELVGEADTPRSDEHREGTAMPSRSLANGRAGPSPYPPPAGDVGLPDWAERAGMPGRSQEVVGSAGVYRASVEPYASPPVPLPGEQSRTGPADRIGRPVRDSGAAERDDPADQGIRGEPARRERRSPPDGVYAAPVALPSQEPASRSGTSGRHPGEVDEQTGGQLRLPTSDPHRVPGPSPEPPGGADRRPPIEPPRFPEPHELPELSSPPLRDRRGESSFDRSDIPYRDASRHEIRLREQAPGVQAYVPAQHRPYTGPQPVTQPPRQSPPSTGSLNEAARAAYEEGRQFGDSVARDAPALWMEAVLARKPRMPSDLEARLLQGSTLPIDCLLHDEVRQALRRGFWDALERARR